MKRVWSAFTTILAVLTLPLLIAGGIWSGIAEKQAGEHPCKCRGDGCMDFAEQRAALDKAERTEAKMRARRYCVELPRWIEEQP